MKIKVLVGIKDFEALDLISQTAEKLSSGEILQIEKSLTRSMTEKVYYDMINKKTASLISTSCELGAITSSGNTNDRNNMRLFGEKLGMAFQIKDDLFDIVGSIDKTGKPTGFDIKKNMLTLPYIYMLSSVTPSKKKELLTKINSCIKKNEISSLRTIIEINGGVKYAEKKMKEFSDMAIDQLSIFDDSNIKESLVEITKYNLNRTR